MKPSAEEVADCGEVLSTVGRGGFPLSFEIVLGFLGSDWWNTDQSQVGEISGHELQVGVVRTIDGPTHVGLPGADPHFTDQNIFVFEFILSLDGQGERLARGFERFERHSPIAVFVRLGGVGLSCNRYGYFFTHVRPTPYGIGVISLENHVAAENGRRLDIAHRNGGKSKNDEKDKAGVFMERHASVSFGIHAD